MVGSLAKVPALHNPKARGAKPESFYDDRFLGSWIMRFSTSNFGNSWKQSGACVIRKLPLRRVI